MKNKIKIQLSRKSAEELADMKIRLDKETNSKFFTDGKPREEMINDSMKPMEALFG